MRWTSRVGRLGRAAKQGVARFGIKAGFIVAGGLVAVGTVNRTTYLPSTPLAARVVASAPDSTSPVGKLARAVSSIAPGGLDAGVEHVRIDHWIERLSTTMSAGFERTLGRKSKYADMITAKLDAKKMPRDLIYLAMIESEFNPNAKSPVKAVGMWQFMSATARQFGLKVRGGVDERKDPARATDAALEYLSSLHDRFGSWYLAAAAYNSGEGTVLKALRRVTGQSVGTDEDFFRIMPSLPKETQDYVPKLIAAARLGNAPEQYGLNVPQQASGDIVPAPVVVKPLAKSPAARKAVPARHLSKARAPAKRAAAVRKNKVASSAKAKAAAKSKLAR